jgi:hypothetical protein
VEEALRNGGQVCLKIRWEMRKEAVNSSEGDRISVETRFWLLNKANPRHLGIIAKRNAKLCSGKTLTINK